MLSEYALKKGAPQNKTSYTPGSECWKDTQSECKIWDWVRVGREHTVIRQSGVRAEIIDSKKGYDKQIGYWEESDSIP